MSKCKVIAITNQKGGVGKTTTTFNLGVALSKLGKKVLLIDTDPQGNLTTYMGYHDVDNIKTIANLLNATISDTKVDINEIILNHKENIDLIPSNLDLSSLELSLVGAMSREFTLKNSIKDIINNYDYILIDCPPSLSLITVNDLACANKVIIPVQTHYFAAKGMTDLIKTIYKVHNQINPTLDIAGILPTLVDSRTNLSKQIIQVLKENYGKQIHIFNTQIPLATKVAESTANGKSIFLYDKNNRVGKAYMQLAKEVEKAEKNRNGTAYDR